MKLPFVLRKTAEMQVREANKTGYNAGKCEILKMNAFELFDKTNVFIETAAKYPITKEWEVRAQYVLLLNSKKTTVFAAKIPERVFVPGDELCLHFNTKDRETP